MTSPDDLEDRVRRLEAERDEARAERDLAKSLHDVAVSQRDASEWLLREVERERDLARAEVEHERKVANEHLAQRHDAERERDEARAQLAALHVHARALCVYVERIRRDRPSGDVSNHLDGLSMSGRCVEYAIANTTAAAEAHDRRVRAAALREAADAWREIEMQGDTAFWLRARADEIERGER